MRTPGPCVKHPLARNAVGTVDHCSCGSVQLHLGATTIRFTPEALEHLGTLVAAAVDRLRVQSEHRAAELASFRPDGPAH